MTGARSITSKKAHDHKLYGFTAVLGYSRMRFITFVKRCDTPTMIRCMMEAFEYFRWVPQSRPHRSHEKCLSGDGRR